MRALGISGSSARSRRTLALVQAALAGAAEQAGVETDLFDLAENKLDFADGRPIEQYSAATREALRLVREADAVILGTPMYRGTFTGALKNLLDLVPREDLLGKSVGLIATGASYHHYLGLDFALRGVLAFFQAHVVPSTLYVANVELDQQGGIADEKVDQAARQLGRDTALIASRLGREAAGPPMLF